MLRNLKANSFNRLKKQILRTVKSETVQRFLQTLFQFDSAALSDIFDFNKPDISTFFQCISIKRSTTAPSQWNKSEYLQDFKAKQVLNDKTLQSV